MAQDGRSSKRRRSRRLGSAIALFVIAGLFGLLGELHARNANKPLEAVAEMVRTVPSDAVRRDNEGALVHVTGLATAGDRLADPEFGVIGRGLRLIRYVEMYQWREHESRGSDQESGRRPTAYRHTREWSARLIDSSRFRRARGHENPRAFSIEPFEAQGAVSVGAFRLAPDVIRRIEHREPVAADLADASEAMRARLTEHDGWLHSSADSRKPQIGDVRIRFQEVEPVEVSVIARQHGERLETYPLEDDEPFALVRIGTHTAKRMIALEGRRRTGLAWIARGFSVLLLAGSLCLMWLSGRPAPEALATPAGVSTAAATVGRPRRPRRLGRFAKYAILAVPTLMLAYAAFALWPVTLAVVAGWIVYRFIVKPVRAQRLARRLSRRPRPAPGMVHIEPVFDRHPSMTLAFGICSVMVGIVITAGVVGTAMGQPPPLPSRLEIGGPLVVGVVVGVFALAFAGVAVAGVVRVTRAIVRRVVLGSALLEIPKGGARTGETIEIRLVVPPSPRWRRRFESGRLRAALECLALMTFRSPGRRHRRFSRRDSHTNECVTTVTTVPVELGLEPDTGASIITGTLTVPDRATVEASLDPRGKYMRARKMFEPQDDYAEEWTWTLRLATGFCACWFPLAAPDR